MTTGGRGIVRFAIAGAGAIAGAHATAIQRVAGAELLAVTDINPLAGHRFSSEHGCRYYESLTTMLSVARPDALVLCSPPHTHPELAIEAIEAGVHVLCEKPLAIDLESAKRMLDAAAHADVLLTMATKFRYVEDIIRARNMIRLGVLGDIHVVANEFRSPVDMSNRWNAQRQRSGGGVIIDNGTHSVDILRYLLGPIESVSASDRCSSGVLDVEDGAEMLARFADGAFGSVRLSWTVAASSPYFLQIVGSLGRVAIGWKESVYLLHERGSWQRLGDGYDKLLAFTRQYENVIGVIGGSAAVEVGYADALSSVAAISAAYASLRSGTWVAVNGTLPLSSPPEGADRAVALL